MRPSFLQPHRRRRWAQRALAVYASFLAVCAVSVIAACYSAGLPQ